MKIDTHTIPEFEILHALLAEIIRERNADASSLINKRCNPERLLSIVVERMAPRPLVALARIWLVQPGDRCLTCAMADECTYRRRCLHLVASSGVSMQNEQKDWSRISGRFQRIALNHPVAEHIISPHRFIEIHEIEKEKDRMLHPEWVQEEGILGVMRMPLYNENKLLGVLVLFSRSRLGKSRMTWLRLLANQAVITKSRFPDFEIIEREKKQLELENAYLREELNQIQAYGNIIGRGPAHETLLKQIELVAPTDASVLITGESGTGKELVAREIHKQSLRRNRTMVKVNCASIPGELYESEFFGHIKGAFTGAANNRVGRFQAADGGTLFLDEVGEIPLALQGKLLRVLQEGEYERVGEEKTRKVDTRIIAATNRDLKKAMAEKRFRKDLYFRLNVFPIEVTPLCRRKEDIPVLAMHFLSMVCKKMKKPVPHLTQSSIAQLQKYDWPGNVRELQNIIERAVIISRSGVLDFNLSHFILAQRPTQKKKMETGVQIFSDKEMKEKERQNMINALEQCGWKIYGIDGASMLLGIRPTTFFSRMKKMNIKKPKV